jgi:hypothetical protein
LRTLHETSFSRSGRGGQVTTQRFFTVIFAPLRTLHETSFSRSGRGRQVTTQRFFTVLFSALLPEPPE